MKASNVVLVTGVIYLDRISRPSSSPWQNTNFTLIYGLTSLSLNIVLTLMIVIRLYLHRRSITKSMGRRHAAHYTSIISILIESAAVLVVMTIFFLIPFAMGNPIANIPLLTMVQIPVRHVSICWYHWLTLSTGYRIIYDHLQSGPRNRLDISDHILRVYHSWHA